MSDSSPSGAAGTVERRTTPGRLLLHNGAQLLGLTGLAVAQPLLDLFGRNPTYFVATGLGTASIVALATLLTFGLPLLLVLVELVAYRIDERAGRLLHLGLVGVLGVLLGAGLARHVAARSDVLSVALALGVGAGLVLGLRRVPAIALGLRYLALAPLLVLGAFLFGSETSSLLFGEEAEAATSVEVGRPAPIVLLQLDELPLASIIRSDGTINEAQFPGFARLASQSTWYRNATSASSGTNRSVPSILSGIVPESEVPTSVEYPNNLFTLLGDSYDLDVHETVARLCPRALCDGRRSAEGGLGGALTDALLVFGHVVLPPAVRSSLAPVDRTWGGFLGRPEEVGEQTPYSASEPRVDEATSDPQTQGQALEEWIDRLPDRSERTLSYAHVLLPHSPWLMTPIGLPLTNPGPVPGLDETGRWTSDPTVVREGLRRHLLQVQYTDREVGRLIDQMEELGTWEETMVVVVADHGAAFTPGEPNRVPAAGTEAEIFSVPLFIKYPGQTEGAVNDVNALTIDVLPTVVDALDVATDWRFDGRSLLESSRPSMEKPVASNESLHPVYVDQVLSVAARNEDWLPGLGDGRGLAPVEPYVDLMGRPLDEIDLNGDETMGRWQTYEAVEDYTTDATTIPLVQVVTVYDVVGPPPDAGLFVVNDRVAGVATAFGCDGTTCSFQGLLDEALLAPTENRMELLLPDPDTPGAFVRTLYVPMDP